MKDGKSRLIQAVRSLRDEIYAEVREQLSNESRTYQQIAKSVGCNLATVQRLPQTDGHSRPVGPKPELSAAEATMEEAGQ